MNQGKHPKFRSIAAFALALALCLTLAVPALAADDATASSIRLAKTEGTVSATNSAGRSVSLVKNLRLFNGYHVKTEAKSYAWLNLDSAKLLKEDASSSVEVRKSGKKLEVLVSSGSLFFNVTEPLDDDETLNIRTSTTLTGVRGTCGWVEVIDRWNTNVYILEGKVECAVTDPVSGEEELTTISAGETATFTVIREGAAATNGVKVTKKSCEVKDVPGYVLVDLAQDRTLCNDIRAASGLDILGDLSRSGDPAAEARRRQEAEEQEAAARLASIAAAEQAQANNVEAAPNTAASGELNMVGTWGWRYDSNTKTLYIGGTGAMDDFALDKAPWYGDYSYEMESAVIAEGITRIGNNAFRSCHLTSVTIPNSVTSIGEAAFALCNRLTSVAIPTNVTKIEAYAFDDCTGLTEVSVPDSVKTIGEYAFYLCFGLKIIRIGSGVTNIDRGVFSGCHDLTDVYYNGSEEQWRAINVSNIDDVLYGVTVHYAGGSTPAPAEGAMDWRFDENTQTLYISGSGAMDRYVYDETLYGNTVYQSNAPWLADKESIKAIEIQNGITQISDCAFYTCYAAERITIPDSVTSIGFQAFHVCQALKEIRLPSGITRIENSTFNSCSALTGVTIPAGVVSIGALAFHGCKSLTGIAIPDGVTSIGDSAFSGCSALTSVTIPSGVTGIEYGVFDGCSSLTSVTIPSGVTSIGSYAFGRCSALTDVYYGGSQAQWNAISIGGNNDYLINANIHYNSR